MGESRKHWQVLIIGSGPAGLTAAIYTARANLEPLVIDGMMPGGQLTTTTEVENFPGFPEGKMGPELMDLFRQQAERFGTKFVFGEVTRLDLSQRPFHVWVEEDELTCDALIVASGASPRWLGLESESFYRGFGVSSCATCDGSFFRNLEIVVVGGGDSAVEETLFLTHFGSKVTIIHRRDELRASKIMQKRAQEHPKIAFVWNSVVTEVLGKTDARGVKQVTGVRLRNVNTNKLTDYPCSALFVAIGHLPNTSIYQGHLDMDSAGYLKVVPGTTQTSVPGVFAAGDVADSVYRQAVTAAGRGCMAALDTERFLLQQE